MQVMALQIYWSRLELPIATLQTGNNRSVIFSQPDKTAQVTTMPIFCFVQEDRFGNGDVVESTAEGWRRQIFHRIRAVFGFGLGL